MTEAILSSFYPHYPQGYIIRILQHFATKLWNITNFVMLFQAVLKYKSRQKFHHSLKEHHQISNIPKFRCEML
jgi:valyl-tRNA synthetase